MVEKLLEQDRLGVVLTSIGRQHSIGDAASAHGLRVGAERSPTGLGRLELTGDGRDFQRLADLLDDGPLDAGRSVLPGDEIGIDGTDTRLFGGGAIVLQPHGIVGDSHELLGDGAPSDLRVSDASEAVE